MRNAFAPRRSRDAQTFVFFALTFGTIFLLCGLAIDSGLLFLAKARMSRSVDGAALAAVGNFSRSTDPATNRSSVATIMRNFAVANYTDLGYAHNRYVADYPISTTSTEVATPYTTTTGETAYTYTYNFNDGTKDANGAYRKYVQVVLTTGAGGQITTATCNSRCPVGTYFIGAMAPFFRDLKVSASSVATRNPRLIMIVVDRSGSMLSPGGGAYGLPQAVVQFLDFFDTSADYIGIVSFGSSARLEMPLTTNFLIAGTNILFNSYQTNGGNGTPGTDPEMFSTNSDYDVNYSYSGVRRMKFGGTTAADEGIRLGMEELMNNSGFNDPDVVKYMVLFTDGAWNETRTLVAAPGYTNVVRAPPAGAASIATNSSPWNSNMAQNVNLMAVPTFCEATNVTDFLASINADNRHATFADLVPYHDQDIWQSTDGTNEPLNGTYSRLVGVPMTITNFGVLSVTGTTPTYSRYIDVWLQPGAVDYHYHSGTNSNIYVSDLTHPTNHVSIKMAPGDSNVLIVPGYVADGLIFDGLDLCYPDDPPTYPRYRVNNFQEYFMWPDDHVAISIYNSGNYTTNNSLMRQLMFRNYPNLLTGFYVTRPDEPNGPTGDVDPYTGAQRASYGLGPYYPAAGFYWPFDLVGVDVWPTYMLTNATVDPDIFLSAGDYGGSRHESYSINMLSYEASPEWCGEWFYSGTAGSSSISSPGSTAISSLMTSKAAWQSNAPTWLTAAFDASGEGIMTNESAHNTNVIPTASVWRPNTFMGNFIPGGTTNSGLTAQTIIRNWNTGSGSTTGGYVIDGSGNVYYNSMAYSGRPTHYFDFSQGQWIMVGSNHKKNIQALPLGIWKVQEYAWHARDMGVTIYSVGYGYLVTPAQQVILAQVANATNTTAGNPQGTDTNGNFYYTNGVGTAITYNPNQPIGQQYYATNSTDISNDFYQVGTAINAALTQ